MAIFIYDDSHIRIKGKMIFCILIFLLNPCQSQELKGLKYEDNLLEARFGPENGYAIFDTGLITRPGQPCQAQLSCQLSGPFKIRGRSRPKELDNLNGVFPKVFLANVVSHGPPISFEPLELETIRA